VDLAASAAFAAMVCSATVTSEGLGYIFVLIKGKTYTDRDVFSSANKCLDNFVCASSEIIGL
jgi:hypothetical protein